MFSLSVGKNEKRNEVSYGQGDGLWGSSDTILYSRDRENRASRGKCTCTYLSWKSRSLISNLMSNLTSEAGRLEAVIG